MTAATPSATGRVVSTRLAHHVAIQVVRSTFAGEPVFCVEVDGAPMTWTAGATVADLAEAERLAAAVHYGVNRGATAALREAS